MKRSLSSWLSPKPKGWIDDQRRYRKYLKKITPRLPAPLVRLTNEFSLHDDQIYHVQIISRMPSSRDALVTIKVFRDGFSGTAGLLVLHFIDLQGAMKKPALQFSIMYFDVEVIEDAVFRLTFALDEKKTWSMKFRDFSFYFHDYRKQS